MKRMVKSVAVVTLLLLTAVSVYGQELRVKAFHSADNDKSAVNHCRSDRNGEACTLLKVKLPLAGVKFSGNVVGEVSYHDGEYWVYQTNGSRLFQIHHTMRQRLQPN